jgi:hypothetical protein
MVARDPQPMDASTPLRGVLARVGLRDIYNARERLSRLFSVGRAVTVRVASVQAVKPRGTAGEEQETAVSVTYRRDRRRRQKPDAQRLYRR